MTITLSVTEKKLETQAVPPRLYAVILLNDDYTPMEFVVQVLMDIFAMDLSRATQVMMQVHYQGRAMCGAFTKDVAEMKVMQVDALAIKAEHPLKTVIEPL